MECSTAGRGNPEVGCGEKLCRLFAGNPGDRNKAIARSGGLREQAELLTVLDEVKG